MSISPKEPLSHERIIQAALAILDSSGVSGLSMRKLGASLHVEAASLYHHIPNKNVLIQKVIDAVSTKAITPFEESQPWTKTFYTFATNYREILRAHPGIVSLVATHSVSEEVSRKLAMPLIVAMEKTTANEEQVLFVIQSIAVFVIGHALAEVGNWPEPPTAPVHYYDQWFETGITAMINGFKLQFQE
ncbi:TetR/AcrR family transcriptional regulator [Paenibacillus sp. KN14-4R]|uniref:TetR/AcrR family transcriptional regulator n=1 Tax=Paenibacillus sp. KN14-4R TaxID=3445773 RepID=UPI003F9F65CE